jgi:putative nucleotidyltransferase with HDIG domain
MVSLAGGAPYAIVFGLAVIGWAILLEPAKTPSRGNGGVRAVQRAEYGFALLLAGTISWLVYRLAYRLTAAVGIGLLGSEVLSAILAIGAFYLIETALQSVLLAGNHVSPVRIWQRNYPQIFPQPLVYALLGYILLRSAALLGLWMAVVIFFLTALWLHISLSQRIELLERFDRFLAAIARAVDGKDPNTENHSANVARVSVAVAREMGMSEAFLQHLERAAILHDVGKVSWPDQVLLKRALVDAKDLDLYKWAHPEFSASIAEQGGLSSREVDMIRYHHEHYGGGGYLHGLKGDDIPIGARIICLADSFDAMTHERAYGSKYTISEALDEVERCSGTQFDPTIVAALLRVLPRVELKTPPEETPVISEDLEQEVTEEAVCVG